MKKSFGKNCPGKWILLPLIVILACLSLAPVTSLAAGDMVAFIFADGECEYEGDPELIYVSGSNEVESITFPDGRMFCMDGGGAARFSLSLDLPVSGYQVRSLRQVSLIGAGQTYTVYNDGASQYGGSFADPDDPFLENVVVQGFSPGIYRVSVNYDGTVYTDPYAITFAAAGSIRRPPEISSQSSLPKGYRGRAYTADLEANPRYGGVLSWEMNSGSRLPAGLSLSSSGRISGTPTKEGDYYFVIRVSEEGGGSSKRDFHMTITELAECTVSFSLNRGVPSEGHDLSEYDITVDRGSSVTLPAAPVRAGYMFQGWTANNGRTLLQPGEVIVVSSPLSYTAWWESKGPVLISTEGLEGSVVGSLALKGLREEGEEYPLWGQYVLEPVSLNSITYMSIPSYEVLYSSYTGLRFYAQIDGVSQCIAKYDGEINEGSAGDSISLVSSGLDYTLIDGVSVEGTGGALLQENTDYSIYSIRSEGNYASLPFLTADGTAYKVKLNGVYRNTEIYQKYDWTQSYDATVNGSMLVVGPEELIPGVTVSGTVQNDGKAVAGVTVSASQYAFGMNRIATAETGDDGSYSLSMFENADASFSVLNAGRHLGSLTGGRILTARQLSDNVDHDIIMGQTRLDITVVPEVAESEGQRELASRYLLARVDNAVVSAVDETDDARKRSVSLERKATQIETYITPHPDSSANASLTVTVEGESFSSEGETAVLSSGIGSVTLRPGLKPGVLARLKSQSYGGYVLAWYNEDGNFIGASPAFWLSSYDKDVGSACPAGVAGRYTVVLTPSINASWLPKTVDSLTDDVAIKTWNVDLLEGKIAEMASFTVDEASSVNSRYITRPNSTLVAARESFSTTGDLVTFSGSIGLDSGFQGGRLESLSIDPTSFSGQNYNDDATLYVKAVSINGKKYDPGQPISHADYYYLNLSDDTIELPCDFTIYAMPGVVGLNMEMTVYADVSYAGSGSGRIPSGNQYIGRESVARPGSAIFTLSDHVNQESILLNGMAQPEEGLCIYDAGSSVGFAKADRWGEWTARVPLSGTKANEPTEHVLYAITDGGVRSSDLVVIHDASGPQLTALNISWGPPSRRHTIAMGEKYNYTGSMEDVTFTAAFSNPGALKALGDAENSFDTPVVFVVNTSDGNVLYLEGADKGGGVFEAGIGETIYCSVESVFVLYQPAFSVSYGGEGEGAYVETDPDPGPDEELARLLEAYNVDNESSLTWNDILTYNGEMPSYGMSYDPATDEYTLTGVSNENMDKVTQCLRRRNELYAEDGLAVMEMGTNGPSQKTTLAWLNDLGNRKVDKYDDRVFQYSLTRSARDAATIAAEREKFSALAQIRRGKISGSARTDVYILTDASLQEDGSFEGGSYWIEACLLSDPDHSIYTVCITATYSPGFTAYTVPEELAEQMSGALAALQEMTGPYYDGNYDGGFENEVWDGVGDTMVQGLGWTGISGSGLEQTAKVLSSCKFYKDAKWCNEMGDVLGKSASFFSIVIQGIDNINALIEYLDMDRLMDDMRYQRTQPCFSKLTRSQRQMADDAFERVLKAKWNYEAWRISVSAVSNGLTGAGAVMTFSGGGVVPGLIVGVSGMAVSHFGGNQVIKMKTELVRSYMKEYNTVRNLMRNAARLHPDCNEPDKNQQHSTPTKEGNSTPSNGGPIQHQNDPSGIVYEGVIENPVEGAAVTLYYAADDGDELLGNEEAAGATKLVPAYGMRELIPRDPVQVTGEDGRFQWGVPEGLWFVSAEYAGMGGNSHADLAATERAEGIKTGGEEGTNLLPVLPIQLDVNIPLVNTAAPAVANVEFGTDAITIVYSRYMEDGTGSEGSVLNPGTYSLKDGNGNDIGFTIEAVEQGHTPANIDGDNTRTYTRTVRLVPSGSGSFPTKVALGVSASVKSYAGVPMGTAYSGEYDSEGLTASFTGSSLLYEFPFPGDGSTAYVLAASYNEAGKILDTELREVYCNGTGSGEIPLPGGADSYRLFVLDEALQPLAEAWSSK